MQILLLDVDPTKVCTKRPNGVQVNSCFVIDRLQLSHGEDWLVTDVGSFENRGHSMRFYIIEKDRVVYSEGICSIKDYQNLERSEGHYLLQNVFYRHRNSNDFWRTTTTISDCNGHKLQLGMIAYHFTGDEHPVVPHKHPRTGKAFVPTAPSTRKAISEKVKSHKGPRSIFDESMESTGDILHCEVMADMPRDIKQI